VHFLQGNTRLRLPLFAWGLGRLPAVDLAAWLLAGEGRVHQCLRFNRERISDRCRKEEMKLAALEYRDIRLRPKLNKLCSEEKAVFCKVSMSAGTCISQRCCSSLGTVA
jgi:hypothetical protein